MPKTIAMYGDSYVNRLKEYCDCNLRVPGKVCWFDKGGLRLKGQIWYTRRHWCQIQVRQT